MGSFKVIIAGGSISGLTLALALERAGIDFIVLEKGNEIGPQLGASLGLHPHSLKVLDQLGVWKGLEKTIVPLMWRKHFDCTMKCFEESVVLEKIYQKQAVIKALHAKISDKSKVLSSKGIDSYEETETGVRVTTRDGSTYEGDILVGADGVHSTARKLISEAYKKDGDAELSQALDTGYECNYKCIFAISRNDPKFDMPDGWVYNAYFTGHSTVAATGVPGIIYWFLFVKCPKTQRPNCPNYTEEDCSALIDQYGDVKMCPQFTVRDLWDTRNQAILTSLEEGVMKKWSKGRTVLCGDAIHKYTINAGLGGNTAIEDVSHLANMLNALIKETPKPTSTQLTTLFEAYENRHHARASLVHSVSHHITCYEAQESWLYRIGSWVSPWVNDEKKAEAYANFSRQGPWLDYLPVEELDPTILSKAAAAAPQGNKNTTGDASISTSKTTGLILGTTAMLAVAGAAFWTRWQK
ncbi:MAG: hypothetical protein M1834_002466 [Cirrosporium novae-zelandiae]|nr:MAG: hypothetical protein M1834_002466 [Cirrosporium novae-zelandiae]